MADCCILWTHLLYVYWPSNDVCLSVGVLNVTTYEKGKGVTNRAAYFPFTCSVCVCLCMFVCVYVYMCVSLQMFAFLVGPWKAVLFFVPSMSIYAVLLCLCHC